MQLNMDNPDTGTRIELAIGENHGDASSVDKPRTRPVRPPSIARNVASVWVYYAVVVVAGFIVPRLIDRHEGPHLLGVWDFGWTLVAYVSLLQLGIVAAVNRYVARYAAVKDTHALNQSVNTSLALLAGSAVVGVASCAGLLAVVPTLLQPSDPVSIATARWTILLLAMTAGLKLPLGALEGVLTGHERYDILNLARVCRDIVIMICMIVLLFAGYGIISLALTVLCCEAAFAAAALHLSRRIAPSLRISPAYIDRRVAGEMLRFGGVTMLQSMARTGLYQFNSLLVAFFLGPVALAVYSRQRSLVFHAVRFLKKYSNVFVPTSGRLHASGDTAALQQLLINGSRYGFYIALPIMAVFLTMGGPLLEVWMGADYRAPLVLGILALGHALALPQEAAYSVLMGMGRHWVPSVVEFVSAACGVTMCAFSLGYLAGGMLTAALAIALPVTIAGGIVAPIYACHVLNLSIRAYAQRVMLGPLIAVIPFAGCLLAARWACPHSAWQSLAVGLVFGGIVLACIYWAWVIPAHHRTRLLDRFALRSAVNSADAV